MVHMTERNDGHVNDYKAPSWKKPSFTKGGQIWDYLYAKDAGGILFSLGGDKSINGKIYCLGSGVAKPLKSI